MLIAVIFSLVVISGVIAKFYFFSSSENDKPIKDASTTFEELKQRAQKSLNNPAAIQASLSRNANQFACLYSEKGVCLSQGGSFLLYESSDVKDQALSQLTPNQGMNADGLGCKDFPSVNCPLHVEAKWTPVCNSSGCDYTKSGRFNVTVIHNAGDPSRVQKWSSEALVTPQLQLTSATECARQGGTYNGAECLIGGTRIPASEDPTESQNSNGENNRASYVAPSQEEQAQALIQQPAENSFICPESIILQGVPYVAEVLSQGRAEVRLIAANKCPATDSYVFQCSKKQDPSFDGEGEWQQVESHVAPPCDENGRPLQPPEPDTRN